MRLIVIRAVQFVLATTALTLLLAHSRGPIIYTKDLQSYVLPAMALRNGGDVLAPLSDLGSRYFPASGAGSGFPHPSPHPPLLAALSVPLTLLPYQSTVLVWLALNLALLLLVGRWLKLSALGSLALAAWPPIWLVLEEGQVEIILLVLVMLAWRAADERRDWRAGYLLGLAAALKLYPALLVLPFLARRRWRVVVGAGIVFGLSQLTELAILGPSRFLAFYLRILPAVSARYSVLGLNVAPYGALLRLFGGAADLPPLVHTPGLVVPIAVGIAAAALLGMAALSPAAGAVAMLLAMPNVWGSYAVYALPQIAVLLRHGRWRLPLIAALAAASFDLMLAQAWSPFVQLVASFGPQAPAIVAVLGALQPLGFGGVLAISVYQEFGGRHRIGTSTASSPTQSRPISSEVAS